VVLGRCIVVGGRCGYRTPRMREVRVKFGILPLCLSYLWI
jgi:hypothetical protein